MATMADATTSAATTASAASAEQPFHQWVDYLPSQLQQGTITNNAEITREKLAATAGATTAGAAAAGVSMKQRPSMDPSSTNMTEENSTSMDMEDWPDSNSFLLEDSGYQLLPPALLIDHDPIIQQEIMLSSCIISDGSSMAPEMFAHSLEELLEQRRHQLAASMQASQRTRQFLEPHIRQRAGLSNVLQQIERSSLTLHQHLLVLREQAAAASASSTTASLTVPEETNSVDMTGIETEEVDPDVEAFAAQVLAGHDDDDDDVLLI